MKKRFNKHYTAKLIVLSLSLVLVLTAAACGASTRPSVQIQDQTNVSAGDVTITVSLDQFDLSGSNSKKDGKLVYYLDATVPTYYDHSAVSNAGTYAVTTDTAYTWSGVTPGEHQFSVQLVDNNDSPLPRPAVDSVTLQVGPPSGEPAIGSNYPQDGDTLPPGNIIFNVNVSNFIISGNMGVVNRLGEGHLIYYIDETPPVDAGVPATTDTSIVSTQTSHLWKAVGVGTHTLSAQLVNNDDTPLDTPVVLTVTVDVSAG